MFDEPLAVAVRTVFDDDIALISRLAVSLSK